AILRRWRTSARFLSTRRPSAQIAGDSPAWRHRRTGLESRLSACTTFGPILARQGRLGRRTSTRHKEEICMSDGMGRMDRRQVLKTLGAAGVMGALGARGAWAIGKFVVGVIYVGPRDDYGYNQAQAQAAAAIKKMPGVTVVEQEKVPETTDVQKTMGSMIEQDGATLLFPTSLGNFDPPILKMAEKSPTVPF